MGGVGEGEEKPHALIDDVALSALISRVRIVHIDGVWLRSALAKFDIALGVEIPLTLHRSSPAAGDEGMAACGSIYQRRP